MSEQDPITIIGGGILGVSIAYHLNESDRPIQLLEKESLGAGTTSESLANFGVNYPSPIPLRRFSHDHYFELIENGTISYQKTGGLLIKETEEGRKELERTAEELNTLGYSTEFLSPDEVKKFGVQPPTDSVTLYIPDKGYLDPSEIISYWADTARNAGVDIRTSTDVVDILVDDGAVQGVETVSEIIETGTVVNAGGPWAPEINEWVGVSLPLRHNYGPILVLEADDDISLPFVYFPNKHYFREESSGSLFAGQRGSSYENARRRNPDHARSVPESFYLSVQEQLAESLLAIEDARLINEWYGMRTITPDGLPIVGETGIDGFYVACGGNGKGITLAPAIGHILANDFEGEEVTLPSSALDPDRF